MRNKEEYGIEKSEGGETDKLQRNKPYLSRFIRVKGQPQDIIITTSYL